MKLLVGDDPHIDAVPPHHGKNHLMPLLQPILADGYLLREREKFWRCWRLGAAC
jgi:hypothetical protein